MAINVIALFLKKIERLVRRNAVLEGEERSQSTEKIKRRSVSYKHFLCDDCIQE